MRFIPLQRCAVAPIFCRHVAASSGIPTSCGIVVGQRSPDPPRPRPRSAVSAVRPRSVAWCKCCRSMRPTHRVRRRVAQANNTRAGSAACRSRPGDPLRIGERVLRLRPRRSLPRLGVRLRRSILRTPAVAARNRTPGARNQRREKSERKETRSKTGRKWKWIDCFTGCGCWVELD